MVTVTIMMVLAAGGAIYLNRFGSTQKVESTKLELLSSLRLARNYAMTKQLVNEDDPDLKYVSVIWTKDGLISASVNNDIGTTYFSKDVSPDGIGITNVSSSNLLWFSAFNGKLVKDDGTGKIVPVDESEKVILVVNSKEGVGNTKTIEINSSGLIDEKQ